MANETCQATWKTYQDAWAEIPTEERAELIRQSVAEDCTFISPSSDGKGYAALVANIEEFQKTYPGATFQTSKMIVHHGQALAEWMMYDGKGAAFLPGRSYARFGADGRLMQLVGFWEL